VGVFPCEPPGRYGRAYVETDPAEADASTIVRKLLQGQYGRPLRVLALNPEEGWVQDVSELIARKLRTVAQREKQELTDGTRAFIDAHTECSDQLVLPLRDAAGEPPGLNCCKNVTPVTGVRGLASAPERNRWLCIQSVGV
jgi:hypothetical protein